MSSLRTRQRLLIWLIVLALTLLALFVLQIAPAGADATYHTDRVELTAVGGAPLRSGFIANIHPNGPQVAAHEVYVLNGAEPNSTYQVLLVGYVAEPTCSGTPLPIPTAMLTTNVAGNGRVDFVFTPADVPAEWRPPNPNVHGVRWEIHLDGALVYESDCNAIPLD